ncbi:MAG: hypothetical protein WBV91_01225 [Desulfobacterales bacterium]
MLAAVGDDTIKEKLLKGEQVGDKNFKVHIDGYNFLPYLEGKAESGPRDLFFAFVDDGSLGAMRYKAFKFHFSTQTRDGIGSWFFAQETRKAPLIIDLRADPFELAPEGFIVLRRLARPSYVRDGASQESRWRIHGYLQGLSPRQEAGRFTPVQ